MGENTVPHEAAMAPFALFAQHATPTVKTLKKLKSLSEPLINLELANESPAKVIVVCLLSSYDL